MPILIHAGRGMPPLADGLADLALRHPGVVLILAHGAICDQGILTSRLADHPGVLYDISCFFPLDVIELFARVPAERIVFASDPPYGLPATTLYMALRVARQAGLDEAATRGVLGGTMAALIDGRRPAAGHAAAARRLDHALRPPRARVRLRRAWSGRRCSPASSSRRRRCSKWRSPRAATPSPAATARRSRRSARRSAPPTRCSTTEDGIRAAIDLLFRSIVRAATEIPDAR